MKKLLALLLLIALAITSFTACGNNDGDDDETDLATSIRVGYMQGPTGMGMAKLIQDNGGVSGNDKYSFQAYTQTSLAFADFKAGKVDVICVPTNEAANYFNTEDDESTVLSINTLNTLFVLTTEGKEITSFEELAGKTVYTCQDGNSVGILQHLMKKANIELTISTVNPTDSSKALDAPKDLVPIIKQGTADYIVAPEPIISNAASDKCSISLDLSDVWAKYYTTQITMGCIIANKSFVNKNSKLVLEFLDEYEDSINYIGNEANIASAAKYIEESGILGSAELATSALSNLKNSIVFISGEEMKTALVNFYNAINGISIRKLPDNDFYYIK